MVARLLLAARPAPSPSGILPRSVHLLVDFLAICPNVATYYYCKNWTSGLLHKLGLGCLIVISTLHYRTVRNTCDYLLQDVSQILKQYTAGVKPIRLPQWTIACFLHFLCLKLFLLSFYINRFVQFCLVCQAGYPSKFSRWRHLLSHHVVAFWLFVISSRRHAWRPN